MILIQEITPSETWDIRHRVMWPDMPFSYVQLEEDEKGIHFGLFSNEKLKTVISLFIDEDTAQFRKFATEKTDQGKGYGFQLLMFLIKECKKRGVKTLWCNSRLTAFPFYQKLGFELVSEKWLKDGVEYVKMEKKLNEE